MIAKIKGFKSWELSLICRPIEMLAQINRCCTYFIGAKHILPGCPI
jgi:hypothetical protein